jgi:hypothetical protein
MDNFSKQQFQSKDFELVIDRIPGVTYFCVSAPVPGVSATAARYPTPFTVIKYPGDALVYDPLTIRFRVNSDLTNYHQLLKWMEEYGTPDNFDQYNTPGVSPGQQTRAKTSLASLLVFTNKYNPQIEFIFEDLFPISIGTLEIHAAQEDAVTILCDVTFDYTKFTMVPLTNQGS